MTERETLPDNVHPEAALLPWYVNGTLPSEERVQVDRHVAACDACRAELDELVHLRTELRASFAQEPSPSPRLAEAVKTRIARETAGRTRPSASPSMAERFEAWCRSLLMPRWAPTFVMLLVVAQGTVLLWMMQRPAPETIVSRSLGPAPVQARVAFQPQATEEQLRAALHAVGARVVDGPDRDGVYLVEMPHDPRISAEQKVRAFLERNSVVKSADLVQP